MLRKIVENIVNRELLNEITVIDAYGAYYKNIPEHVYEEIVGRIQPGQRNLLPDTKWVLQCYKSNPQDSMTFIPSLHKEDNSGFLDIYNRLKSINRLENRDRNLNNFKSLRELCTFVEQKMEEIGDEEIWGDNTSRKKKNMNNAQKTAKNDIDVVYEDEDWFVLIPKSYEASVYWGSDTSWCTAYKDQRHYYDDYSKKGKLYININKKTKEKYQFHFETESFMDKLDEDIETPILKNIGASEGLDKFYAENLIPQFYALIADGELKYKYVRRLNNHIEIVEILGDSHSAQYPYLTGKYTLLAVEDEFPLDKYGFDSYELYPNLGVVVENDERGTTDFITVEGEKVNFRNFGMYASIYVNQETNTVISEGDDYIEIYIKEQTPPNKPIRYVVDSIEEVTNEHSETLFILIKDDLFYFFFNHDFILDHGVDEYYGFTKNNHIEYSDEYYTRKLIDVYGNNVLNTDELFDDIAEINDDTFIIKYHNDINYYIVNQNCEKIFKKPIKNYWLLHHNVGAVINSNDKDNVLLNNGKLISPDIWFDRVESDFYYGVPFESPKVENCMKVIIYGKTYFLSQKGNLYDENEKLVSKLNESRNRKLLKQINENLNDIFKI